jgi:pyridoxamine 5'-phosphate oxidase
MTQIPSEGIDPIQLFREWFAAAETAEINDPNALALATATPSGVPSVRMVLLKRLDERGFAFFTNAESQKGLELAANPHAALCFHWKSLRRQVRVQGVVSQLPAAEADEYFHSRGRGSQYAAAASRQSQPLPSRQLLEDQVHQLEAAYPPPAVIPRPPHWLGYVLAPHSIEFWQDGPNRLHDRILYTRGATSWQSTRLYP